jgi:hypothetical protein
VASGVHYRRVSQSQDRISGIMYQCKLNFARILSQSQGNTDNLFMYKWLWRAGGLQTEERPGEGSGRATRPRLYPFFVGRYVVMAGLALLISPATAYF